MKRHYLLTAAILAFVATILIMLFLRVTLAGAAPVDVPSAKCWNGTVLSYYQDMNGNMRIFVSDGTHNLGVNTTRKFAEGASVRVCGSTVYRR